MNLNLLSSEYYLIIGDDHIDSHLPQGVFYNDHCLTFQNREPIQVQIVYILKKSQEENMNIEISSRCVVDLIVTKVFEDHAIFHQKMMIQEDAVVHIFNENHCINQENVSCNEEIYLQSQAICQCGYAELSDGSIDASYHYYLEGEGADAKVRMAILSKEKERKHYEVLIEHRKPHTYGQMDNYGVVKDEGHLIIDGIGTITKGQHGSASHQTNKIMVFDLHCVAGANPYLYIDEYDVKASHAAGVGKMDEEHLYYLQSRGLTKKQAMHLITYGYLKPVIEVIDNEMLKERFEKALSKVGA